MREYNESISPLNYLSGKGEPPHIPVLIKLPSYFICIPHIKVRDQICLKWPQITQVFGRLYITYGKKSSCSLLFLGGGETKSFLELPLEGMGLKL